MDEPLPSKEETRQRIWDRLEEEGAARFPYPPHGRIPNFAGAGEAARRLGELPLFRDAEHIKVNPDAPQRHVRLAALRQGIVVWMPTPRLGGGFQRIDPARIPGDKLREAASLSKSGRWAEGVGLEDLPQMDLVVVGSVAVSRRGERCGKGHGYADLEYAILRELGHPAPPVATTVHPLQVVERLPRDPHDVPVSVIVTPEEVLEVPEPPPPPDGLEWDRLGEESDREMPVLRELRDRAGTG